MEGGFDKEGTFVYLPISDTSKMTELFRRLVIKYYQENKLINERFALNLVSWKNSGFSVNNTIRVYGNDNKAREALSQYIAKPPVSLEKISYGKEEHPDNPLLSYLEFGFLALFLLQNKYLHRKMIMLKQVLVYRKEL